MLMMWPYSVAFSIQLLYSRRLSYSTATCVYSALLASHTLWVVRLGFVRATWRVVTSADVTICFLSVSLGFYNQNRADRNVGTRFKKDYLILFKTRSDVTIRSVLLIKTKRNAQTADRNVGRRYDPPCCPYKTQKQKTKKRTPGENPSETKHAKGRLTNFLSRPCADSLGQVKVKEVDVSMPKVA